jgi:DNA-binding MarR family transcriptional regulator
VSGKPPMTNTLPALHYTHYEPEKMTMTSYELADMSIEQLNLAFDTQGLTPGQKVVLLVLANRANKGSEAWPAIDSIARQSCLSRSGVKNALRELQSRQLLVKKTRRNRANVYHLTLDQNLTKGSPSDRDKEESKGQSLTEGGHSVTPKGTVTDPVVATQCPQTIKNHQVTTIEPKGGVQQNLNIEAWQEYMNHRKDMKLRKLTPRSEEKAKQELCLYTKVEQAHAIDKTIANGWQGIFPEKAKQQSVRPDGSDPFYENVRRNIGQVETPHG